jgi:hypothetical protein
LKLRECDLIQGRDFAHFTWFDEYWYSNLTAVTLKQCQELVVKSDRGLILYCLPHIWSWSSVGLRFLNDSLFLYEQMHIQ